MLHAFINLSCFINYNSIQKRASLYLKNSHPYSIIHFEILYRHFILVAFRKTTKNEKGFSFCCFDYISTFSDLNMVNKKPCAELEELWW